MTKPPFKAQERVFLSNILTLGLFLPIRSATKLLASFSVTALILWTPQPGWAAPHCLSLLQTICQDLACVGKQKPGSPERLRTLEKQVDSISRSIESSVVDASNPQAEYLDRVTEYIGRQDRLAGLEPQELSYLHALLKAKAQSIAKNPQVKLVGSVPTPEAPFHYSSMDSRDILLAKSAPHRRTYPVMKGRELTVFFEKQDGQLQPLNLSSINGTTVSEVAYSTLTNQYILIVEINKQNHVMAIDEDLNPKSLKALGVVGSRVFFMKDSAGEIIIEADRPKPMAEGGFYQVTANSASGEAQVEKLPIYRRAQIIHEVPPQMMLLASPGLGQYHVLDSQGQWHLLRLPTLENNETFVYYYLPNDTVLIQINSPRPGLPADTKLYALDLKHMSAFAIEGPSEEDANAKSISAVHFMVSGPNTADLVYNVDLGENSRHFITYRFTKGSRHLVRLAKPTEFTGGPKVKHYGSEELAGTYDLKIIDGVVQNENLVFAVDGDSRELLMEGFVRLLKSWRMILSDGSELLHLNAQDSSFESKAQKTTTGFWIRRNPNSSWKPIGVRTQFHNGQIHDVTSNYFPIRGTALFYRIENKRLTVFDIFDGNIRSRSLPSLNPDAELYNISVDPSSRVGVSRLRVYDSDGVHVLDIKQKP
jgi:hypothetical protein